MFGRVFSVGIKEIVKQRIPKNFSVIILAQFLYKFLSFFTFIIIARNLGASNFGQFSYALSFAAIFVNFIDFGLSNIMIRDVAGEIKEKIEIYLNNILTLKLILSVLIYLVAILTFFFIESNKILFESILILCFVLVLDSYSVSFKSAFNIYEKFNYSALSIISEGALKLMFILLIKYFFVIDILSISFLFLFSSTVMLIFNAGIVWSKFIKFKFGCDFAFLMVLFKKSLPIAFISLFQLLTFKIDTIMLSRMTNSLIVGWFAGAVRFIEPMVIIPVTFVIVTFPAISRAAKNTKESLVVLYKASNLILFVAAIPIVATLFFAARFIVYFFLGKDFLNSIIVLKILSWSLIPLFLRLFLENFVLVVGRYKIIYISSTIGIFMNIILNLILIPPLSHLGVCIATVLSELSVVIFIFFMLKSFLVSEGNKAMSAIKIL